MLPRAPGKRATRFVGVEYDDGRVETTVLSMPGEMRDWQIQCVCGGTATSCNSGWMKAIEDAAQPVLEPLILGQSATLSEADQKLIATWAILKVTVVHHRIVHHMRRKQMRSTKAPTKGWSVWIGSYDRKKWKVEWQSRPFSVISDATYARRVNLDSSPNVVAATQIIKHLFIHVVYCPMEDFGDRWRFSSPQGTPLSGQLLRIWPPSGIRFLWPQKALSDIDALNAAEAVFLGAKRVAAAIRQGRVAVPTRPTARTHRSKP